MKIERLFLGLIQAFLFVSSVNAFGQHDCDRNASRDSLMLSYIQDSVLYACEKDIEGYKYVCSTLQPLRLCPEWEKDTMLTSMVDYYNACHIYGSISTDGDAYIRFLEAEKDLVKEISAVDVSSVCDPEFRNIVAQIRDLNAAIFNQKEKKLQKNGYFNWDNKLFIQNNGKIYELCEEYDNFLYPWMPDKDETDTAQLFRAINPATYFPPIYSTYVGQEAEPDNGQTESLYNSMLAETDVDLRNAKLITLAGCMASENIYDYKERVLYEMEKSMKAGTYSPLLFTLWRAYRCLYNELYACASKDCYSPNIRYNYYRRLVAHTILKYVAAHPDDVTARFLFQRLSAQVNILRHGPYSYGNQSALEWMYVFWNGEIW
jgi:hypothetical protein